ncbi:PEPxxWA-CTERM sorting domain-containing protein [Sphingomonas sp. CARO-RG-8B-R24-01]|uniref:PEPxxWA-CTERM sorting domain-containing protein n=1 Tax=Sphingomonas sp. CARO-RG-8B-R24-01 TaxID=2914831 RepID=UPI001F584C7C|nr:PEPxxWA-CTERM sorting domain-containing protein [Sphingomonas sp. CARO-RG-8B-R24-01]
MKFTNILSGTAIAIALSAAATAADAATVTIDFTALASGTAVTTQYPGVTFSLAGGLASGAPTIAYYGAGLSNSPKAGEYPTADSLIATFATPVSDVSFVFSNQGYNGANNYRVYSPSAVLLASGPLNGTSYTLSSSDIGSIVWSNGEGTSRSWTQALSKLSFTPGAVPEPSTWAMMLAGFGMIGFAARRRGAVKTSVRFA